MKKLALVTLFVSYCVFSGGCHPVFNLTCESTSADAVHACVDYLDTSATCQEGFSEVNSCPTASVLGTCTKSDGLATFTFYSDKGNTAEQAQAACQALGADYTWKAQN